MNPHSSEKVDCVEKIIEKYSETVYKLAFSNMRQKENADDVYQEVFLSYIKSAPEFESEEHEKAWFIKVTVNCCRDMWRKESRHPCVSLEEAEDVPAESKNEVLAEYLLRLSPDDRILIHLLYFEGYSAKEIAEMTGKSPSSVRMKLSRARRLLKKIMEEDGFYA